tara:strand:- start:500 stop:799 length:300 start_codon:yes stop_codon:yes gene_type:complete
MKVKVSYSVNIEQVMSLVKQIYNSAAPKHDKAYQDARLLLNSDFDESQISDVLLRIKSLRESMADMDLMLSEVGGMLLGYEQICLSSETPTEEDMPSDD